MRFFTGFAGLISLVYAGIAAGAAPSPAAKPDLERGKQIATTVCAACHGTDGNSALPVNPVLASQHGDYIALQLAAFKSGARPSPIMQGMAAGLSAEDMRNLGAYYESRKAAPNVARDKALAQRGQQIWRGGIKATQVPACAGCHGASGMGIPVQYPRLAGQHADLALGWLKAFASGARPHSVMSPVAVKMSEYDMRAVAEYAAGLR
ncbi:MAG: c-type cytochrome [Burkholderiales bacterium]